MSELLSKEKTTKQDVQDIVFDRVIEDDAKTRDARQIANWYLLRAFRDGLKPSVMTLLKLTFIAHGWHLAMRGQPLFGNRIEAWRYGPVIPEVYHAFRQQGIYPASHLHNYPTEVEPQCENLLEQVHKIYGHMSPARLSELTHVAGGPWHIATQVGGNYAYIPNDLIKLHYVNKRLVEAQTA